MWFLIPGGTSFTLWTSIAIAGDQPENVNYAVIITNGESDATDAESEALLLRQAGAVVLAIGVGPDINHALLVSITAAGEKVYTVPSFDDLEENPTLLVETICPGTRE